MFIFSLKIGFQSTFEQNLQKNYLLFKIVVYTQLT